MQNNVNFCLSIDGNNIYEFSGKMNEKNMINSANSIEKLLLQKFVSKEKIQNVFELFVETIQNILTYSANSVAITRDKHEVNCDCTLSYFTENDTYILESCNLIYKYQKELIEQKLNSLKDLDKKSLRKLIRTSSRSRKGKHQYGAGLGYILMTLKSTQPIDINFSKYNNETFKYKQKLVI